jgi:hypothetical protein
MNKEYCPKNFMKASFYRQHSFSPVMTSIFLFLLFLGAVSAGNASQTGVLEGKIIDIAEKPVQGAEVYIFDSPDVKRPADFISNRTTANGGFKVLLPPGNYWAVAIYRQAGGRFGPLASGDKHSGEPLALEVTKGLTRKMDFMVVDLREAARRHQKKSADLVRISGRVVDEKGRPVPMAYAMANKMQQFGTLPEYISPWTGDQGEYAIYLPPGRYYLGAAIGFPPKHGYNLKLVQQFVGDTEKIDLIVDKEKP